MLIVQVFDVRRDASCLRSARRLQALPAGVWVDRARRRPVLIAADLTRATLLASVPPAWWAGTLTLHQLYAVLLLVGTATVYSEIAAQSWQPELVGRDRLVAANSLMSSTRPCRSPAVASAVWWCNCSPRRSPSCSTYSRTSAPRSSSSRLPSAAPAASRGRHGPARPVWLPGLIVAPLGMLVAVVDTGVLLWLAALGWLALAWHTGTGNVIGVSLRQAVTPDPLLGRMNATFRFLLTGAIPVGAALAGRLDTPASAPRSGSARRPAR